MKYAIACAALLALAAACGNKTETPTTPAAAEGGPVGPAAATPDAAASAQADILPEMMEGPAPGKWKVTTTSQGQTLPATETCFAKMTMGEMQKMQQAAGVECSDQWVKRVNDQFVMHSVCKVNNMTVTSDTTMTGDLKTKYSMDIHSRMDPPPMPNMAEQTMTITAERLGDC